MADDKIMDLNLSSISRLSDNHKIYEK